MEHCSNCLSPLQSTYRFCPGCGQKTPLHRFNLPAIFEEFAQAITDLDKGILHLVKQLAIRPGTVAREFILEGKRKKYFNPFSFLLLVLGLSLSVNAFVHPYTKAYKVPSSVQSPSVPQHTRYLAAKERQQQVQALIEDYSNLVSMLAIPLFAAVYYLYFLSSKIYYAEHLVANVLFASFYTIVSMLTTLLMGLFFKNYLSFLNAIQLAFEWVFLTVAYGQFLGYRHPRQYLRTTLATLLALLAWVVITAGMIAYYIRYGWSFT